MAGVKWERWKKAEGEKRESAGAGRLWRDKSGNGEFLPRKGAKGHKKSGRIFNSQRRKRFGDMVPILKEKGIWNMDIKNPPHLSLACARGLAGMLELLKPILSGVPNPIFLKYFIQCSRTIWPKQKALLQTDHKVYTNYDSSSPGKGGTLGTPAMAD